MQLSSSAVVAAAKQREREMEFPEMPLTTSSFLIFHLTGLVLNI